MKNTLLLTSLLLLIFTLGCGLTDTFKTTSNNNVNSAAPTMNKATPTATATPTVSPTPIDKAAFGTNWLAFGAGTIVVDKTSEARNSDESARHLIDESGFGWKTAEGAIENQSVTLELPARTTFKSFVFDTAQPTAYDGRAAKDVVIEISDASATEGFQTILEATLEDSSNKNGVDNQSFSAQKEIAGRWVRYTAKNNNGSPVVIFTKELWGYGEQEPRQTIPNVSGTYKMESVSELHLKQDGNSIVGCYLTGKGIVEGTIDGRVMTLTATEPDAAAKGEKTSFLAINAMDNGKKLLSTWWGWSATPVKKSYDRFYVGEKTSDKIGNCPQMPDLDGATDVVKDNLEKELAEKGKAILYGINFDFNSDVIRTESRPTLDKVIAILKEKPDWKFSVEGHTDNIGGEAFNQTLSEKRAASVVKYLTAAGIDQNRLSSKGFGLMRPLAPNNSEAERAQNRRVELVKN